jgi:hypothetical protein
MHYSNKSLLASKVTSNSTISRPAFSCLIRMIEIRKKPTEMKYCSAVIRGEMNKVMIIEKQRFGRGLIREISKYVYKNPWTPTENRKILV